MKTSTKVILGVGGVAVLGFVTYLALKPKKPTAPPPSRVPRNDTPSAPTSGGNNVDTYVKAVKDIIGIFSKPKVEAPTTQQPTPSTPSFDEGNYY